MQGNESVTELSQGQIIVNPPIQKPDTLTKIIVRKFLKNKLAVGGLIVLIIIIGSAILAPQLATHDPAKTNLLHKLSPPSSEFWLGTDNLGRDIFSRLLYGARISLLVGFASVLGSITIGTVIGAVAGYYGGRVDAFFMRLVDIIISFPNIFLLITLVTIFDPGIDKLIMTFALLTWTGTARLVRGEFLTLRSREFVLAAKTLGMNSARIIFFHILPNALGPIIVAATLGVGGVILAESALSFLGLGIQPPTASWGNMLQGAQSYTIMKTAWWYPLFPGLMIAITVLAFNFVGDGLRDAFDPRMKE
ncbi:oligopeptide ABC transporter permease [Caldalkalibacillus mannanilyticus]|uniref:oligopeptide ABC transporter permease n=1 Tax=Caldalkalibacillus mannanilyticus TaxID=1418 RepID=UPI000468FA55|nr:oligopeptide ABC transporter permease [Caldalkalibacillus mannanilyticus]